MSQISGNLKFDYIITSYEKYPAYPVARKERNEVNVMAGMLRESPSFIVWVCSNYHAYKE